MAFYMYMKRLSSVQVKGHGLFKVQISVKFLSEFKVIKKMILKVSSGNYQLFYSGLSGALILGWRLVLQCSGIDLG